MSAFGGKADVNRCVGECPLIAISGHLLVRGVVGLDEQAIADLDNAIRLEPDYATAYLYRGLAYDKMGLYDWTSDDDSKAILLQPDLNSAYFNRGRMHEAAGRQFP